MAGAAPGSRLEKKLQTTGHLRHPKEYAKYVAPLQVYNGRMVFIASHAIINNNWIPSKVS